MVSTENNSGKCCCVSIVLRLLYQFHSTDFVCSTLSPNLEIPEELVANKDLCTTFLLQGGSEQLYAHYYFTSVIISGDIYFLQQSSIATIFITSSLNFSKYHFCVLHFSYCWFSYSLQW